MSRPERPEIRRILVGTCVSPQVFDKIEKERGHVSRSMYIAHFLEQNLMKEGQ